MIESRAVYIGRGGGALMQHPHLAHREGRRFATPAPGGESSREVWKSGSARELTERVRRASSFDGIEAFPEYARTPHALMHELKQLLERYWRHCVRAGTDNARDRSAIPTPRADLEPLGRRVPSACARQRRDGASSSSRRRIGAHSGRITSSSVCVSERGFTEEISLETPQATPAERRRSDRAGRDRRLPEDVLDVARQSYELEVLTSSIGALGRLSEGRYGTLVLTVDPFEETRAFDLVYALRREGNAAPVVCAAPSRGSAQHDPLARPPAGADDFFVTDLPPAEMVERIQLAWVRGSSPAERVQSDRSDHAARGRR
jgi:hypothetical protein